MAKKNLILVTAGFPYGESEQSFLRPEFDRLVKEFQVTVLAPETAESIKYPIPEDISVIPYSFPAEGKLKRLLKLPGRLLRPYVITELLRAVKNCPRKTLRSRLHEIIFYLSKAERFKPVLQDLIKKTDAEYVYTYWCSPVTLTAAELKRKHARLKVLTRFHGVDLYNERLKTLWQPFRQRIAEKCDRLVFVCEAGRQYFLSHWSPCSKEAAILSYLGCRPMKAVSPISSNILTLVSCSNAIPLKRIHLIIEALALLPNTLRINWHHIGDGSELESLQQLSAERFAAKPNIDWQFHGYIPNTNLSDLYSEICPDIFITTSSTEGGTPVSIQEAFSAGIPAIGTAVGGIPELIRSGQTGYLLSADPEPEEIAQAVSAFAACTPQQLADMRSAVFSLWRDNLNAEVNADHFVSILKAIP